MSPLTSVQQQVLILLAQGSTVSAAAHQAGVHRNTIANWRRSSSHFRDTWASVQYEQAMHWRDEMQSLGSLAVETLRAVLTDENASPAIRLRAALAVLDTISQPAPPQPEFAQESDCTTSINKTEIVRETAPGACLPPAQSCTTGQPENPHEIQETSPRETSNAAQSCTTATALPRQVRPGTNPSAPARPTAQPGRNTPCPCGSGLKYKRCCLGKKRPLVRAA